MERHFLQPFLFLEFAKKNKLKEPVNPLNPLIAIKYTIPKEQTQYLHKNNIVKLLTF